VTRCLVADTQVTDGLVSWSKCFSIHSYGSGARVCWSIPSNHLSDISLSAATSTNDKLFLSLPVTRFPCYACSQYYISRHYYSHSWLVSLLLCPISPLRLPLWSSGQSSWLQNGDVLCYLWGTNWIYVCYVEESRPSLWSSIQSSWLQNGDVLCFLSGKTNNFYMLCRRK
jgi:hypothetical protein